MFHTMAYKIGHIHLSADANQEKKIVAVISYEKLGIIYNLHTTCFLLNGMIHKTTTI